MERKTIMGIAAVAGIGMLLYMRKKGDAASISGAAATVGAAGAGGGWSSTPIVVNVKPPVQVPDSKPVAAPVGAATPSGAENTASRFVSGPSGPSSVPQAKYAYTMNGPNGVIRSDITDAGEVALMDGIAARIKGIDPTSHEQMQRLYDEARGMGWSYTEANSKIAAAGGYNSNDLEKVANAAGVKW